jgi:hypothetical protein
LAEDGDRPRWAKELGAETWARINELLYEGHQPAAVATAVELPESKRRSLQLHARKYRHRRVLAPLARLTELLAAGTLDLGPQFMEVLRLAVEQGLTDESKTHRTAAIVGKLFGKLLEVGAKHEEREAQREREDKKPDKVDSQEVVREVMALYGITPRDGDK